MTGMENDREKVPLMKDLHEVGLRHGVEMVVVTIPTDKNSGDRVHTLLIDNKDDTTVEQMVLRFTGAGVYLIKVAAAAEEYAMKEEA